MINKNIKKYLAVSSVKTNKKLAKFLESTKNELDVFFEFKATRPLIFFLNNRSELDLIWGKKTEPWFVGAFKNNSIFIFSPEVYAKESTHKKKEFWTTLKHEYCHAYYTQITKGHYPIWLNEGLASYISGKKLLLTDKYRGELLNVFNYFDRADKGAYAVGQFWVEFLIKKYGQRKFLKLIKSFSNPLNSQQFAKNFYNIYNCKFNKQTFSKFFIF
jgi:hypothetical protein